ncbi:MAG: ABC transporter permease subunit [Conexivisphaerales archaeon]
MHRLSANIFYLPAIVYLVAIGLLPFALSIYFSSPSGNFSSYLQLFRSKEAMEVIANTGIFAFGTAGVATVLGLVLAIFVDSLKRLKRAFSALGYLPYMIPFTASALVWTTIYDPIYGPADYFLSLLGLPKINWLGQPSIQIYSATIVSIWSSIPLAFLLILAGLSSVPKQVREASAVDGMGMGEYYTSVALPMSRNSILTAFLMTLIIAFGNFDLPYILNGGLSYSMATLPFLVWFQIFYENQVAQGLAAAVILTIIVSVFAFILIRVNERRATGSKRRLRISFRIPNRIFNLAIKMVTILSFVFMVFPVYWMILMAFRPQSLDFVTPPILYPATFDVSTFISTAVQSEPYVITTFAASAITMIVTLLLAAPAAYSVARHGRNWLLILAIYLYTLPSASFVFGAYFIVYKLHMLNNWAALILTYPLFTVPFSIWTLSNFYKSLPRSFEEAALVDGYGPFRSFYQVVMPLIRPGLVATAMLSFIFSWHLLLFPLVLSETPYQFNFPPTGSFTVTVFATLFDPTSLGSSVGYNVWAQLASSGLILSLPVILLTLYSQEYLLRGLYLGGTKG